MSLIRVDGLSKSYAGTVAVRGVDLEIRAGEIHALCGHNGAGKSTVVRLLSGQESPDGGAIAIDGVPVELKTRRDAQTAGVALVDQELSVVPSLTVAENLVLGDRDAGWLNRRRAQHRRARRMLDDLGLTHVRPEQRLATLGLGERQLVEIARALGQRARLVILDEPTATLTDVESEHVYAAVRSVAAAGCAVLFVSHRLGEVLTLCDRVTVMRDGAVVTTSDAAALTVPTLIRHMLGESPQAAPRVRAESGETVLELTGVSVPGRFGELSLQVRAGTVYAVAGQLGSGASDVLRGLAGLHPAMAGEVTVGGARLRTADPVAAARAGIAFASNDRKSEGLFLDRSTGVNLLVTRIPALSRFGLVGTRRWKETESRLAERCGFPAHQLARPVGQLSGGNQQKAFVGRSLDRPGTRVLLLDDPTRGVDVGGRAAVHALVRDAAAQGVAVVFSSTELDELVDLADVVLTMYQGRLVSRHDEAVPGAVLLHEMTHGAEAG
ncbi:sugar ABC transporter ATP-binding protein [Cryptosporangium arvum]|uniref:ABC-type sugar transport system, ATPase component n=1 Tax=Cryptosporangium arvum DSM 44712 TaxID=927661 RepID=A0A011ALD2_9ACTN|nr:sugar ABC transporter ATP-binding protein [Cryptosporangium arvum]EXG82736.1 ABC-type sugar transport system, ATPase component [Cryptosporangium arvum DSM 44712]